MESTVTAFRNGRLMTPGRCQGSFSFKCIQTLDSGIATSFTSLEVRDGTSENVNDAKMEDYWSMGDCDGPVYLGDLQKPEYRCSTFLPPVASCMHTFNVSSRPSAWIRSENHRITRKVGWRMICDQKQFSARTEKYRNDLPYALSDQKLFVPCTQATNWLVRRSTESFG